MACSVDGASSGMEYDDIILRLGRELSDGTLLVLDRGFGELLEAGVGMQALLDLGVMGVISLEETEERMNVVIPTLVAVGQGSFRHVIVCCSNLLHNVMHHIVRVARIVSPYTGHFTVMSNISEAAHHEACPEEYAEHCYGDIERMILVKVIEECKTVGESVQEDLVVRVSYVDIPCLMVGRHAFVFPKDGAASFLVDDCSDNTNDDVKVKVTVNAHFLASVSRILDVQPEAFCVGPLAESVGRAMSFIPAHDGSHGRKAAFIIVDRSLDTATASEHSEYFMHMMFSQSTSSVSSGMCRSSLFHPGDPSARSYLDFLMSKTHKEALLFIRKWLKEAIRESKLKFVGRMRPGAVSAEDLQALSAVLYQDPEARMRHASILQIAEIACECLLRTFNDGQATWSELQKAEHVAKLSAEDGPDGLVALITDELVAAGRGAPSPQGIFTSMQHLIMGCYWIKTNPLCTADMLSDSQQSMLGETLAESSAVCILRWNENSEASAMIKRELPWVSSNMMEDIVQRMENADDLQDLLRPVSQNVIRTICSLPAQYDLNAQDRGPREKILVLRLIDDVISGRHVPSMKHVGTSITGLLKSGLGRIGLQHHHPGEYETIVLFVLGGISPHEISHIRSYCDHKMAEYQAKEQNMPNIVLGGSALLAEPSLTLASMFA